MRAKTAAIHSGYEIEPTTRAVAAPIYQTVAYAFDSAKHGAALFNLELERLSLHTRIGNPTNTVLEKRVATLEGGLGALVTSSGQAAVACAMTNLTDIGTNIVSVPQLYGTTATLFAHVLRPSGRDDALCRNRSSRRRRGVDRSRHARSVLREHRQPDRQHLRYSVRELRAGL
jgi:O-acetylhomoserine (thiol)-lyase